MIYGYANRLGYGFCHDCAPLVSGPLDLYTPERDDRCNCCGHLIADAPVPDMEPEGIYETAPCRIF